LTEEERDSRDLHSFIISNVRKHVYALIEEDYESCAGLVTEKELVFSVYALRAYNRGGESETFEYGCLLELYQMVFEKKFKRETGKEYGE